jgi:hypothetical protein
MPSLVGRGFSPAICIVVLAMTLVGGTAALAQDMPDPSLIHGKALPAPELATGTVTVRVVRESIGNDLPNQPVTVSIGGATRTAVTDDRGRAEFTGLPRRAGGARRGDRQRRAMQSDPFTGPGLGRPPRHPHCRHRPGRRAQGRGGGAVRRGAGREGRGRVRRQQPRADPVLGRRAADLLRPRDRQQRPHAGGHRRSAGHRPAARPERRGGARGDITHGHHFLETGSR